MFHTIAKPRSLAAAFAAAALLLTGCAGPGTFQSTSSLPAGDASSDASNQELDRALPLDDQRFSLIIQRDNTEDGTDDPALFTSTLYLLDGTIGKPKEVTSVKSHTYSGPVWWEPDSSVVYYAAAPKEGAETNDHLYSLNLETGKSETLVDDLTYGIDYVAPLDDHQIYLTAGTGGGAIAPVSYDLSTGKLTKWDWDADQEIWHSTRDPKTGGIYVCACSAKEEIQLMKQLNDGELEECGQPSTVYAMTPEGKYREVYTTSDWTIDSFAVNGTSIVSEQTRISLKNPTKHRTVLYDTETGKETVLLEDRSSYRCIVSLSDDGQTLYVDNGDLTRVDLANGEETSLYHLEDSDPTASLRDITAYA